MSKIVYIAIDLIDQVEAQVFEHDDRYTVSLVDLDSGEGVATVFYQHDESRSRSVALNKAVEKANFWVAPVPVEVEV
tara:strand:- start:620 stop:850 length:231 start_codon:yes stop_codon:yes gene_type:complete